MQLVTERRKGNGESVQPGSAQPGIPFSSEAYFSFHFDSKVSFEGFPPLSATLASGVKYNTLPCRSYTTAHHVKCNINMFRVSPAPAPRSILVKKVTFQRREGESSSGSRFNMTCLYPLLSIPPQTIFQPSSGGSLGASQSGYLDMASLREDIAGSIVREPPPYPRYFY